MDGGAALGEEKKLEPVKKKPLWGKENFQRLTIKYILIGIFTVEMFFWRYLRRNEIFNGFNVGFSTLLWI